MDMNLRKFSRLSGMCLFFANACGLLLTSAYAQNAKSYPRPSYLPGASDVIMRSLFFHPQTKNDQQNTFLAMDAFHVSRLEWTYIKTGETDLANIRAVKKSGRLFGGTANAMSGLEKDKSSARHDVPHAIVNLNGESVIQGHMVNWVNPQSPGCVNDPDYYRAHLDYYKTYIDAGAEVIQRDEASQNYAFSQSGQGCFCRYCMKGFSAWLSKKYSADQLRETFKIEAGKEFDFARYLKGKGVAATSGNFDWSDPKSIHNLLKKEPLSAPFQAFQLESDVNFFVRLHQDLNAYAGRYVPFSCNNTSYQRWDDHYKVFDFAMSELMMESATPVNLHNRAIAARQLGKVQVFSTPKTMGKAIEEQDLEALNRKVIATAYASGGLCKVPWDTFNQSSDGNSRYFGLPETYADLFGFIRSIKPFLDQYEEAFAFGKGIDNEVLSPIRFGVDSVYAFCRRIPGNPSAPVVVHLVDWRRQPAPFDLTFLKDSLLKGGRYTTTLYQPAAYDKARHAEAENDKMYAALVKQTVLKPETKGKEERISIPAIMPWAVLIINQL